MRIAVYTPVMSKAQAPLWMTYALLAAAVYNVMWGGLVVLFPNLFFDLLGIVVDTLTLPIWQAVGMIVGVYGVGYAIAAFAPYTHWPIVLVGFLGKLFGPIGFVLAASSGQIPWVFGVNNLTNDLIWWIPFFLILRGAYTQFHQEGIPEFNRMLQIPGSSGHTLQQLSDQQPLMVVFLRHFGCTFCRETLHEIARKRSSIEDKGARVAIVHMGTLQEGADFLARYRLQDLVHFSDPEREIYRAFGLRRGRLGQVFGLKSWIRGALGLLRGYGLGLRSPIGDGFQMPGVFLLYRGQIMRAFRHAEAADQPPFLELCEWSPAKTGFQPTTKV